MRKNKGIPQDGIAGLKENFGSEALSGFMVALLALPLSLGIAKASGFPVIFGLITAIVGGVLVSFFMGSRLSIKGPAAGLIVIASGSVIAFGDGEQGWHLTLAVVVVAGIIQILFGVFKLGKLADFFPSAAIHGMLAAIGIIIMAKQLHLLLGIDPSSLKGKEPLELIAMLPQSIVHENAHLAEIGFACLAVLVGLSLVKNQRIKKIPAPLIVLLVAVPLGFALHIKTDGTISNFALVKIGNLKEAFKNGLVNVDFSGLWTKPGTFVEYTILFALIGSIESLLTAKALDGLDPYSRKTDFNKDLLSVGIGNTISGIFGGLPMISEVARSSANISYGAKTRWSNFFHGIFLLLAVLVGVSFIEMIPSVALAAMLVFVGFRLAHPKEFIHAWHIGKEQFVAFVATVIVTLATDLLIGVATGIGVELMIQLFSGAKLRHCLKCKIEVTTPREGTYHLHVNHQATFTNVLKLKHVLMNIPSGSNIEIDFSKTHIVDHTTLDTINRIKSEVETEGGSFKISGLEEHKPVSKIPTSTHIKKKTVAA